MTGRPDSLGKIASHDMTRRLERAFAKHPGREAHIDGPVRRAAVLILLRAPSGADPELLMIKRAELEGDPWSGHIACPGGRMEPGDHDLAATAIRETWEETGIDVARDGAILGALDDLAPRTPALPPIVIRPYVGIVKAEVDLVLSPEVADAFWVPVLHLMDAAAWTMRSIPVGGAERDERSFSFGPHVVWGLTERALRQLRDLLA